jgi:hypothetical protein
VRRSQLCMLSSGLRGHSKCTMLTPCRHALTRYVKPASAAFLSTLSKDCNAFKFAAGISDATNLYRAIGECVQQVHEALGSKSPPTLLQLFVTTAHRSRLSHAPEVRCRRSSNGLIHLSVIRTTGHGSPKQLLAALIPPWPCSVHFGS